MPGPHVKRTLFILANDTAVQSAAKRAAAALGWNVTVQQKESSGGVGGHDATSLVESVEQLETMRQSLPNLLQAVDCVCHLRSNASEGTVITDVIQAAASRAKCFFLDSDTRAGVPAAVASLLAVIDDRMEPLDVSISLAELVRDVGSKPSDDVPFLELYRLYYTHIQHEAAWVNSRFIWFMFANSALLATYATLQPGWISRSSIVVGLSVSIVTFCLQQTTFAAEQTAIDRCDMIAADWKSAMPQVDKYLYDTAGGGNDTNRHRRARRWMLLTILLFNLLWVLIALHSMRQILISIFL